MQQIVTLPYSCFLSIQVRIDDREVLAATLDDERTIGTEDASLIFGGFPEKYRFENQNNDLSTTEPLIGCLTDLYHNYEYDVRLFVAMLRPVFRKLPLIPEEHQANMGSCQFDELVAPEAGKVSPSSRIPLDTGLCHIFRKDVGNSLIH